jgi:PII-like signaling protein
LPSSSRAGSRLEGERVLLRVFLDRYLMFHHVAVHLRIIELARERGLAGATLLEAIEGFGQSGKLLSESKWKLSNNMEVIVEIIDEDAKIRAFVDEIEPMLSDAIVTLERAHVVRYAPKTEASAS